MDNGQIPALTGARGVAALSVMLAHGWETVRFVDAPGFASFAVPLALFGMSLFFTLSGFVMTLTYAEAFRREPFGRATWKFAAARVARLYPLMVFFFLVVTFALAPGRFSATLPDPIWIGLGLMSWFPGSHPEGLIFLFPGFSHAWSISTEIFFYLSFPLLAAVPLRWASTSTRAAIGCVACVILSLSALCGIWIWDPVPRLTPDLQKAGFWFYYLSPYCRIFEFFLGTFAAQLYRADSHRFAPRSEVRAASAIAMACLVWLVAEILWARPLGLPDNSSFPRFLHANFVNAPAIAALLYVACRYGGWMGQMWSSRWLVFLGKISYSTYLLHMLLVSRFAPGPERTVDALSIVEWFAREATFLLFVIAMAAGLYTVIEMPCRRWLRSTLMPRSADRSAHQGAVVPAE